MQLHWASGMPGALAPSDKAAQLERGSLGVKAFQRHIVQTTSKNEADDYRGDKIAFKSMCIVPAKRLAPALLAKNYFHHYLNYLECPDELQRRDQFMSAKLERNRFPQFAGELLLCRSSTTCSPVLALACASGRCMGVQAWPAHICQHLRYSL